MIKDPVCGMEIDPQRAAPKAFYRGQTYYSCSTMCKGIFDREPEKYAFQEKEEQPNHQHHK